MTSATGVYKLLGAYVSEIEVIESSSAIDLERTVTGIAFDSRSVKPGNIFVAITGEYADGHQYIRQAVQNGAILAVGSRPLTDVGGTLPYVQVTNSQAALATLAAAFHDYPARKLVTIGITGTDGKTTTSIMILNILKEAGLSCGMISTLYASIGNETLDTGFHVTTPMSPEIQDYLAKMVARGVTHVVLEATSHGLDQRRVDECYFDIGVVTNVTHEHLDYHKTYEHYLESKARLLAALSHPYQKAHQVERLAVLNLDDISYAKLLRGYAGRFVSYGLDPASDYQAHSISYGMRGTSYRVRTAEADEQIETPLLGGYNVHNALAAVAVARHLGVGWEVIRCALKRARVVPGRLELIDLGQDFTAVIDFAHTPNALRTVLETVRPMTKGTLICVFGSAGLRDVEKRSAMARHAICLADMSILTAEDPRTESLNAILQTMAEAAVDQGGMEGRDFLRIPDRREAIRKAVSLARPGDLVIALGKGHEQSMCFGTTEYAWDDRQALRAAIAERQGIGGHEMPFLPAWD